MLDIVTGLSNKDIAARRGVSEVTVSLVRNSEVTRAEISRIQEDLNSAAVLRLSNNLNNAMRCLEDGMSEDNDINIRIKSALGILDRTIGVRRTLDVNKRVCLFSPGDIEKLNQRAEEAEAEIDYSTTGEVIDDD